MLFQQWGVVKSHKKCMQLLAKVFILDTIYAISSLYSTEGNYCNIKEKSTTTLKLHIKKLSSCFSKPKPYLQSLFDAIMFNDQDKCNLPCFTFYLTLLNVYIKLIGSCQINQMEIKRTTDLVIN